MEGEIMGEEKTHPILSENLLRFGSDAEVELAMRQASGRIKMPEPIVMKPDPEFGKTLMEIAEKLEPEARTEEALSLIHI
jgi:hypothetical protein